MDLGLNGKRILIAGASGEIGNAAAHSLAGEGAKLLLAARGLDRLQTMAEALGGPAAGHAAMAFDALRADSAARLVAEAESGWGPLDGAVISLGAAQGGDFTSLPDQVFRDAFELKYFAVVRLLQALIPPFRDRGCGRMVVVVGNLGQRPDPTLLPGSSVNAAVLALVGGLAPALTSDGIGIAAINPGPLRSQRWSIQMRNLAAQTGQSVDQVQAERLAALNAPRLAEPGEVGASIAFLVSPQAALVHGAALTADGGASRPLP